MNKGVQVFTNIHKHVKICLNMHKLYMNMHIQYYAHIGMFRVQGFTFRVEVSMFRAEGSRVPGFRNQQNQ